MNENIDLTKILKDCPRGTKLYSLVHGEVSFIRITDEFSFHPIEVLLDNFMCHCYSANGKFFDTYNGECILFPSKDQRDWNKFKAPWLNKPKFDPKTLKPFDKILVRDDYTQRWTCGFFSHINEESKYPFTSTNTAYKYCIPYNDDTKYLVCTTEEAPKYYRCWED